MITHESSLENFESQFSYVLDEYTDHGTALADVDHIVMGGLGGSGIGELIAKAYLFDRVDSPIEVVNDYHLPAYVNQRSLVLLNSYSGNTEETLTLYEEAKERGARIICIAAGGQLEAKASADGIPFYRLPKGYQPRMTIGFGLGFILLILGELFQLDMRSELASVLAEFPQRKDRQIRSAEQIFQFFSSNLRRKFVILTDREFAQVGIRFAQQLNENSKLEAFVQVIPEANHNVLESYTDRMDSNFVLLYSTRNDRVMARFDFLISHLEMENNKVLPMLIPEYTVLSIFDVIYRLDWVSVLMANELGAPLMEVPNISNLKDFLSNIEYVEEE